MFDVIHVTDDELDAIPDEGIAGFLAYERLVREKLREKGQNQPDGDPTLDAKYSYFQHVAQAAEHFDIENLRELRVAPGTSWGHDESRITAQEIEAEVTKLRFRARKVRHITHVELSDPRRDTIQHHIAQLRVRIADSDLDVKKQEALNKKLDELLAELNGQKKVDLAKVMVILGSIATLAAGVQQNIIKFPETMATIASLLNEQKEEADAKRLTSSPNKLLIEDKSVTPDDDIPF